MSTDFLKLSCVVLPMYFFSLQGMTLAGFDAALVNIMIYLFYNSQKNYVAKKFEVLELEIIQPVQEICQEDSVFVIMSLKLSNKKQD